jgi:hypothetical protein
MDGYSGVRARLTAGRPGILLTSDSFQLGSGDGAFQSAGLGGHQDSSFMDCLQMCRWCMAVVAPRDAGCRLASPRAQGQTVRADDDVADFGEFS